MATKFRVNLYFSGFSSGWSENMVFDRTETSPGAFSSLILAPAQTRAKALGKGYQLDAWSVRMIQTSGGTKVTGTGILTDGAFGLPFLPSQLAGNAGDPTFVSGRFRFTDGPGTESRQGFLGGLPDAVTVSGGTLDLSKLAYGDNVSDYLGQCISLGAGWMSHLELNRANVTGYTLAGSFVSVITVSSAIFTPFDVGTVLPARFARVNGRSVINGAHNIVVLSPTTCGLMTARAAGPFAAPGQIRIYQDEPTFVAAAAPAQVVGRAARHNRGRPFVARRGRQPAMPTY